MFDDLVSNECSNKCPSCGCDDLEFTDTNGYFIDKNTYKQEVRCKSCGKIFWVKIDSDLRIIKE